MNLGKFADAFEVFMDYLGGEGINASFDAGHFTFTDVNVCLLNSTFIFLNQ